MGGGKIFLLKKVKVGGKYKKVDDPCIRCNIYTNCPFSFHGYIHIKIYETVMSPLTHFASI